MTTKFKIYFPLVITALLGVLAGGCEKEDNTGYSTLNPTKPTITVTPLFTSPASLVEQDSTFEYTVTLSEVQLVDVKLKVAQVGGTASASDYSMTEEIYINAGSTSAKGKIKILPDADIEETETLTIQVGDKEVANAVFTPVTFEFTISNTTSDELSIDMTWTTDVADVIGLDLAPTEVVDLRLILVDKDGAIVKVADGAGFENLALSGLANGNYTVGADIYSTINAGDFNEIVTLDISLELNQSGIINAEGYSFKGVMTNEFSCDSYRTYFGTLNVSGSTYAFTEDVSYYVPDPTTLAGDWNGDDAGYPSQVLTQVDGDLQVIGLNFGWILDFWGETVIDSSYVDVIVNWCAGEISIEEQNYMVTLYDGKEYPYTIAGSGTFDISGDYPTMEIVYEVFQDGFSPSQWCFENGYMDAPKFVATLTLDPAGKKVVGMKTNFNAEMLKFKPKR